MYVCMKKSVYVAALYVYVCMYVCMQADISMFLYNMHEWKLMYV
jgi:hypothetical protein